jgi:hypothetical protein
MHVRGDVTNRKTEVMMVPGFACALCSDTGSPGIHLPVMTPEGKAQMPRICQPCLSILAGVLLQLLGHAGAQVAAIAVSLNRTGQPT